MTEHSMNRKPAGKIYPEAVKKINDGICPICSQPINKKDFKDDLSRREYEISGLCQICQDMIFNAK